MAAGYPFDDDDDGDDGGLVAKGRGGDNSAPLSITEISNALKRTVEDRFGFVRLRGEISGFKRAASGHLYMSLKDEGAVLDAVMWKGNANRLAFRPEDGVEVIATGKLTTYPGRSKYQIVVERMEIAGEGALLALLEKNRQRFEAEGLFANRRALPFAPRTIGVVTSPTGAVIRDILHRLEDRFPVRVLVWPVMVQGQGAAGQVAAAVRGFADLPPHLPRPDLLIVARGGGSIEDLWAFNEEAVVRAVAASPIPVISAVGHETDTTLCDFAADLRAPTPTAAAEIAVPVRRDLMAAIDDLAHRQKKCALRPVLLGRERLAARAERLPRLDTMLQTRAQRLDDMAERLRRGLVDTAASGRERLARQRLSPSLLRGRVGTARGQLAAATPRSAQMTARLARASDRLAAVRPAGMAMQRQVDRAAERLALVRAGSMAVDRQLSRAAERLSLVRLSPAMVARPLAEARAQLTALERLRLQLDPKAPLQRGYALVCAPGHPVIASREVAARQPVLTLEFADGTLQAVPGERARKPAAPQPAPDSPQPKLL